MEKPFYVIDSRGPFGDECSIYTLQPLRPMSVQDLIDYVLTEKRGEWGYIDINTHRLEYRSGKIISDRLTGSDKNSEIHRIFASGGWSRMDYEINSMNNPF